MLTKALIEKRVEFSKKLTEMFEKDIVHPKRIVFSDEANFYIGDSVNKQNFCFWGSENPHLTEAKCLYPIKVNVWAALTSKGIFLSFIDSSAVISSVYLNILKREFFPWARKRKVVNNFYFMQVGATPHRTSEVLEELLNIYETRLDFPKFTNGGMQWPPYSPD